MLIREVAYATLPGAARRERHAAVARFIESAAGERIEEAAALLAHHWQEAGDVDQAVRFLQLAAEHAAKGWAKGEAVALFGQALKLVPEDQPELRRAIAIDGRRRRLSWAISVPQPPSTSSWKRPRVWNA